MRGGFVACLGVGRQPVERIAERMRWHRGREAHDRCGHLEVARLVDGAEGPTLETTGGVTRLVHGAAPAPLAELERTAARFAALEWDGRTLRASRDPLGQAPLFYRMVPGAVWLATEVAPLVSLEPPRPDLEALSARASFVPLDHRTGWEGIHRVLPGGTIVVDGHDLRITPRRSWDPARRIGSYRGSRGDAIAEFRERFELAVRTCFEPRSGILLSGGLDSGAVAVTLPTSTRRSAYLTHVRFEGLPETHEDEFAAAVAAAVGAPLHTIEGNAAPWDVEGELDLLGVPYNWFPYGIDGPALARMASENVTVVLDGHDGDGVMGLPGFEWGALLAEGAFRAVATYGRAYGPRRALRGLASAFVPPSLRPPGFRTRTYMQSVAPYFRGALRDRVEREDVFRWRWPSGAWRVKQLQPVLPRSTVALEQKELEAASHGIDLRHPFADRALVDFLVALPCAVKGDPGRSKPLLRDALEDAFPALLRSRPKSDYRAVLRRRVDSARCVELIRASKVELPGIDYRRLFETAARDPDSLPLFLVVNLARVHAFVRRTS